MDINRNLILIKGEDKTVSITSWRYDNYKPVVFITFNGQREYPYNTTDVRFLKDPEIIKINDEAVIKDGSLIYGVEKLLFFGMYCRIVYKNKYFELVGSSRIKIVKSALCSPKSKNCFEYLKQIAIKTGLVVEGHNILAERYEKIGFIREDSVMANFLSGKYKENKSERKEPIIYPFGFNLSQKTAVDNALNNSISIIEGPPGTGKTQTILNIIANAVMRGESVAVVSSNNSATANVLEKLKKYGVDFIVASLGNNANKEAFIESQSMTLPDMENWKKSDKIFSKIQQEEIWLNEKLKLKNELSAINAEYESLEKEYAFFGDYYLTLSFKGDMPIFSKKTSA